MGSGKSTLGRGVAKTLDLTFVDLDIMIESRYCMSVSDYFAKVGEDAFRKVEQQMLHEVSQFEDVIISTGGGTPCFFDNMDYMNEHGTSVYLSTDIDELTARLEIHNHTRPVLRGRKGEELRQFICENLEARMPHYAKAQLTFDANQLNNKSDIDEAVSKLCAML